MQILESLTKANPLTKIYHLSITSDVLRTLVRRSIHDTIIRNRICKIRVRRI